MKRRNIKLKYFALLALLITILLLSSQTINAGGTIGAQYNFNFQLPDSSIQSLNQNDSRLIVIDWAASWCPICKENQKNIDNIYDTYKDFVNFITISYGGSGDDLSDLVTMQGSYPWTFGLDHENFASQVSVSNAYVWLLTPDRYLQDEWAYTVVPQNSMVTAIDNVLNGMTIKNAPDMSADDIDFSSIPEPPLLTGADNLNTFNLQNNPLFLGFIGLSGIAAIALLINRFRS